MGDILTTDSPEAKECALARAAAAILAGELVAIPTETVYGLAADATNDRASARIFDAKGRPRFNPLIVHVADLDMARRIVDVSPLAERLARAFWPGPLTLVLPRTPDSPISQLVGAGLDTLAVRAPRCALAQDLIRRAGRPLAAPSANRSGALSPTRAEHVRDSLGAAAPLILDGGRCAVGIESTIVKIDGEEATLLRPGAIARRDIERTIGRPIKSGAERVEAPGMLQSHYAPRAPLRLDAAAARPDEAFLGFGAAAGSGPAALNLSPKGDLVEAAANLFAHLCALDALCAAQGRAAIAVAPIPDEGLGEAINDRLRRAAAPRG
jgi:L-threonylcarbamoyladenylate synthase